MFEAEGVAELVHRGLGEPRANVGGAGCAALAPERREHARAAVDGGEAEHAPVFVRVLGRRDVRGCEAEHHPRVDGSALDEEVEQTLGTIPLSRWIERRSRQRDDGKNPHLDRVKGLNGLRHGFDLCLCERRSEGLDRDDGDARRGGGGVVGPPGSGPREDERKVKESPSKTIHRRGSMTRAGLRGKRRSCVLAAPHSVELVVGCANLDHLIEQDVSQTPMADRSAASWLWSYFSSKAPVRMVMTPFIEGESCTDESRVRAGRALGEIGPRQQALR